MIKASNVSSTFSKTQYKNVFNHAPVLACTLTVKIAGINFQQHAQKPSGPGAFQCYLRNTKNFNVIWITQKVLYRRRTASPIPVTKKFVTRHLLWWQKSPQSTCPRPEHFCRWCPRLGSPSVPAQSHGWKRTKDPALAMVIHNCLPENREKNLFSSSGNTFSLEPMLWDYSKSTN